MRPKLKIKKNLVVLLSVLFSIALLAQYAIRDIALDVDLLRESIERVPSVVLENLEFEREISGDLWQVHIPMAERREGRVEVRSIDVTRRMENGREWYFRSAAGFYSEKAGSADLVALLGTLETDSRVLNLESPYLSWLPPEMEGSGFFFPRGLTIYDSEFLLTADVASIDEEGVILLDRGGVIKWTQNMREAQN
jgi:hypothetical protein